MHYYENSYIKYLEEEMKRVKMETHPIPPIIPYQRNPTPSKLKPVIITHYKAPYLPLSNPTSPNRPIKCTNCGGNHFTRKCPSPRLCFKCGLAGHIRSQCPKKRQQHSTTPGATQPPKPTTRGENRQGNGDRNHLEDCTTSTPHPTIH